MMRHIVGHVWRCVAWTGLDCGAGKNYYEVDVDVGASRVARGIMGVIVPQQRRLIIDEAFVIEGQTVEELPVRMLLRAAWCGRRCMRHTTRTRTCVRMHITTALPTAAAAASPPSSLALSPPSLSLSRSLSLSLSLSALSLSLARALCVCDIHARKSRLHEICWVRLSTS